MNNYEDIINLNRPESNRPKMSILERASQFAPFAALEGYNAEVKEVARRLDSRIEIDDALKEKLNDKIKIIKKKLKDNPTITITYFVKDSKKDGGKYIDKEGIIRKIDDVQKTITMYDKSVISILDIINIKSDIFEDL